MTVFFFKSLLENPDIPKIGVNILSECLLYFLSPWTFVYINYSDLHAFSLR